MEDTILNDELPLDDHNGYVPIDDVVDPEYYVVNDVDEELEDDIADMFG